MELITDLVDLARLTGAAREIENPANYDLEEVLPVREIEDVEYALQTGTITRGVAQYRAWDAETPIGKRRASVTRSKQPLLPLGQKLPIGEYETIMLRRAQGAQDGNLVNQVYDDTRSNVLSIRSRVQIALGQVLSTGTFVLDNENGLSDVADFAVRDDHLGIAPADLFSDPDSDLFGFFEQLAEKYQADSDDGQLPGAFTTSRRVLNAMRSNKQIVRAIWGPLATEGRITPQQVSQALDDQSLPRLRINETRIAGRRVIPSHKIIITPSNPSDLGRTVYGITAEALELIGSNAVDFTLQDAPGVTAVTMKAGDPVAIWSKATATCLPVLERPELLMTADVLAAIPGE